MIQKMLIMLAALFLGLGFARAGTIDPQTPDEKHIIYGKDFHCVGRYCGIDKNGVLGVGSCVAIRGRVVLTAAHVVHDVVTSHIHINDKQIDIRKVVVSDKFTYGGGLGGDIAICFLADEIGLDFYPELYEKSDEIGRIASISGYGIHGTFHTGGVKSDKHRRGGSNKIEEIIADLLIVTPSSHGRTALEFCITPGDSGGGMFIDNKLAGINCCVFHGGGKELGKYGHEGAHTRISQHKRWVQEVVELHEVGFHGNEFIDKNIELVKPVCIATTIGDE